MGMKTYNKLIRDKIPEIIENKGGKAEIRVLSDEEYVVCLDAVAWKNCVKPTKRSTLPGAALKRSCF